MDAIILKRWSCYTCNTHFELPADMDKKDRKCLKCGETHIVERCKLDPVNGCHCALTVNEGIRYCPECGKPICPKCGDHDVTQISRVTGYLQDVGGWNAAKQQELKDRTRTQVSSVGGVIVE